MQGIYQESRICASKDSDCTFSNQLGILSVFAAMAELVDALDSGSSRGNLVEVRLFLAA